MTVPETTWRIVGRNGIVYVIQTVYFSEPLSVDGTLSASTEPHSSAWNGTLTLLVTHEPISPEGVAFASLIDDPDHI